MTETKTPLTPEDLFDRAVDAVRDEAVDPEAIEDARARVWARLTEDSKSTAQDGRIEGCDDVQSLLPAYLEGRLPEPRRILVEQHTRECVACRRALITRRTRSATGKAPAAKPRRRTRKSIQAPSWLPLAAGIALAAVGLLWLVLSGTLGPAQVMAEVDGLDGRLWKVTDDGMLAAWSPGEEVREGERLRTAKGSGAVVRLADGSLIEMSERAELTLDQGWRGTTIRLDRGQILVEAARQRGGKLYVATADCRVSVVGTVFSVNHGLKGSRVSVLEGEVHVARRGEKNVLLPGDQVTTRAALGTVPLEEEIAWSRDRERYLALLAELQTIRRELDERLPKPDQRFTSRLLPLAPADTVGYVAVPNLGEQVGETWNVIRERVAASPVLAEWWQDAVVDEGMEPHLEELVTRVRDLGSFLGEEIVLAIATDFEHEGAPILLAEVVDGGLRAYLVTEIERLEAEHGPAPLVLVDDPAAIPPADNGEDRFLIWIGEEFLLATPDADALARTAAVATGAAPAPFPGTSFHQRLEAVYREGVEWLFAADVSRVLAAQGEVDDPDLQASGFADLEHIVIERHRDDARTRTRALVAFSGPRRGIASWLAAPAPMGALDYVSSHAAAVTAFVVRDPASMLEELLSGGGNWQELNEGFAEAEAELGIDLRRDVIDALGGEIAFAVDGPLAPEPAWKMIVEVYDPVGLQAALEAVVERAAAEARAEGATVSLTAGQELDGRPVYDLAIRGPNGQGFEVSYLYADGFLIAAPSRALLDRALQVAAAGTNITTAPRFRELLPDDGEVHFSALAFQDLASALGGGDDLSGIVPDDASETDVRVLMETVRNAPPTLGYAYGREDAIELAATSGDSGLLGFGLWSGLTSGLAGMGAVP